MHYISSYLAHNYNNKNLFFIINNSEAVDVFIECIQSCNFNKVYVLFRNPNDCYIYLNSATLKMSKKDLAKIIVINSKDLATLDLNSDTFITVLHNTTYFLNRDLFDNLLKIKPHTFVYITDSKLIENFALWEKFRNVSSHIYIAQQKAKCDPTFEVLDWYKTDNDIELSIILPVYKVEKYIKKCIETITEWAAPYIEFIFVNDGSPDKSMSIVEEYAKIDSRIKLINKKNEGCASARQAGLEVAKGKYIGFIDPDDFVDPTMFYKLFSRALIGNYDISWCGYNEYYTNNGKVKVVNDLIGWPYDYGVFNLEQIYPLICYRLIGIWRAIYRKDFLAKNNIKFHTEIKRFDDLPFKIETLALAKTVVSVPEYLYYYRLEREGQDTSCTDERMFIHFKIFKILDRFFYNSKVKFNKQQIKYYNLAKRASHRWALSLIDKKYRKAYKKQMKQE